MIRGCGGLQFGVRERGAEKPPTEQGCPVNRPRQPDDRLVARCKRHFPFATRRRPWLGTHRVNILRRSMADFLLLVVLLVLNVWLWRSAHRSWLKRRAAADRAARGGRPSLPGVFRPREKPARSLGASFGVRGRPGLGRSSGEGHRPGRSEGSPSLVLVGKFSPGSRMEARLGMPKSP